MGIQSETTGLKNITNTNFKPRPSTYDSWRHKKLYRMHAWHDTVMPAYADEAPSKTGLLFWHSKENCCIIFDLNVKHLWDIFPNISKAQIAHLPFPVAARSKAAARLLRSWVWIPPGAWIFVCCESCVLSCRGLCDELITRPEESYRLWCVIVCDLETSRMGAPYIYIYMTLVA